MRKRTLNLDDLVLQSFETTCPAAEGRGTVLGHQEDTDAALTCPDVGGTQILSCTGCETYDEILCGPDGGRRIIVYS